MAQVQLEKMSYRFDVITSYEGNTYILSKVQQAIADARTAVEDGNAVVLSITEFHNGLEQNISGDTENSSVDVLPVVDGNDLVVYYVDTSHGHLVKVKYPKL